MKTLKFDIGELSLGEVSLIDLSSLPDAEGPTVRNPLALNNNGTHPVLRYRQFQAAPRDGDLATFNIDLGVVAAASSIVFSSALVSTPAIMTVLLLLSQESEAGSGQENEPSAILIEPARDGNTQNGRIADQALYEALLATKSAAKVKPVATDVADMMALIETSLKQNATIEIAIPVPESELTDIEMKLPRNIQFDEDGVFYFRDVLSGEQNLLVNREEDFADLQFVLTILSGGVFYRLADDEEYAPEDALDFGSVDGADDTFRVLRVSAENAESELSRGLIIAAGHAEEVQLEFNVYAAGQLVFIEILVGDLSGVAEHAQNTDIDTSAGLPDEDIRYREFMADEGAAEDDELRDYPTDIL